jgi:phosphate-selective porin OprO/OprP
VAYSVAAALIGMLGCHAGALPTVGKQVVPSDELQGPPAPGIRLPGWLPRGELFWDGSARYRLFNRPRFAFQNGMPSVTRTEEPVIAGRFGVKLQVDAAGFVERGGLEHVSDDVDLRRAFLTSSGTFNLVHPVQYNLEFGLLEESFYLDSAWLMVRDVPWLGSVKLGGLDAPLGFDNLVSSRDRIFMEVPAPVQAFVPATSVGIEAVRTHHDGRGTWAFGWFTVGQRRDVGDQSRALARVAARTTWLARDREDGPSADRWPELVHVGIAGAYTFAGTDHVRYQARPESFLAPIAVDTDDIESRSAVVGGFELAARRGPLSFQAEYLQAFVDRASVTFPGMYVSAAYLLTGEVRPYDREQAVFGQVLPARPLDLRARRFGAFECAARWSWVDLDDGPVTGGRMHLLGAGLNWYWNRWVRWQLGYELAFVDGGTLDGRLHVLQGRFQLVL